MIDRVGIKHAIIGAEHWPRIFFPKGLSKMPHIPKGHKLVGGLDCDDGELVVICETLGAVKELQHEAAANHTNLSWYHTDVFS